EDRPQRFELVDVVAVGLGEAAIRQAVGALLQPHHLRLAAMAHVKALMGLLELLMDYAEVAAAVGGQMPARIDLLLAVAEAGAEDAGDALVPGKLHEGLGIGNADQLGGLGAVADIVLVAVDEEIGGRSIDQLEALFRDALPVIRRHALADDAPGDGD